MIERIREYFKQEFDQEPPKVRMERVKVGILIAIVGATVYALVAAYVNIISYPGLNLGVSWTNTIVTWLIVTLALILAGFIVGWPTEEVKAIVGGGVELTVILLLVNTIAFLLNPVGKGSYFQVLVTTLPMIGVSVLATLALRQGINKISMAKKEEDKKIARKVTQRIIGLVVILGIVGGFFSRFDGSAVTMLQALNTRLKSTDITGPSTVRFPENVLKDVQSHYGEPYHLFVRSATATVGALDVTIQFNSGYAITCQIPTTTGSYVFMDSCSEGDRIR